MAAGLSVNGQPCFLSFQWLNQEELTKMADYVDKIRTALDAI